MEILSIRIVVQVTARKGNRPSEKGGKKTKRDREKREKGEEERGRVREGGRESRQLRDEERERDAICYLLSAAHQSDAADAELSVRAHKRERERERIEAGERQ